MKNPIYKIFPYCALRKYVFISIFYLLSIPAFSQVSNSSVKRMHITMGGMLRSSELIDQNNSSSVYSYAIVDRFQSGGNLGIMYQVMPHLIIGYNSNLRYGIVYYQDGLLTEPIREFIADHNVMSTYKISKEDSKLGIALGLGHSWINTNKAYTFQSAFGTAKHEIDFRTLDIIASFSYKRLHLEPKIMFNFSEKYAFDLGNKDPRLWLNLRAYYALGIF